MIYFKKQLTNKKGSALITVLIIVSLLTILGTGLMMMSITGLRKTVQLAGSNKAFYITDGAIEECLAEINDYVFDAEAKANNHIDTAFEFEKNNIFDALDAGELDGVFLSNDTWKPFLEKLRTDLQNETISEEEAMEHIELGLRCEFLKTYYAQLLNSSKVTLEYELLDGENYKGDLDLPEVYLENALQFSSVSKDALETKFSNKLKALDINDYVNTVPGYNNQENPDGSPANNPVLTSLEATYTEANGIRITIGTDGAYNEHNKAIELIVKVTEPKYQYVFKSSTGKETILENELMNYTITSGKDLIVSEGTVNVTGDVYAYGTFPESDDYISQKEMGGVLIGYKSESGNFLENDMSGFKFESLLNETGTLKVTGHLYTRSNVKINNVGNDLTVTKNLGANEFRVENDTVGSGTTDVKVDGNMYLFEDMVLRGEVGNTNIRVGAEGTSDGDLYLILDSNGNALDSSKLNSADMSGSILIQDEAADKTKIDVNLLNISGLSFAGVSRLEKESGKNVEKYFMTGESMTVENKYMKFYESDNSYSGKVENHRDVDYYNGYDSDGNPLDEHSKWTYMESYEDGEIQYYDSDFKSEVFMLGAKLGNSDGPAEGILDIHKKIIKIRSINAESDYEKNYALGVVLAQDNSGTGYMINPEFYKTPGSYKEDSLRQILLNASERDVDRFMNLLATRNIMTGENETYNYADLKKATKPKLSKNNKSDSRITQMIDFSSTSYEMSSLKNLRIVNDDVNKDIYINPPGVVGASDIVIGGTGAEFVTEITGIIATEGDIYVYSPTGTEVDLNCLLIAEGRVIFYGAGTKNISVDREKMEYQIAAYSDMRNAFHADEGRTIINLLGYNEPDEDLRDLFNLDDFDSKKYFTIDINDDQIAPVIVVIPTGKKLDVDLSQPPILVGMQKNKGIKGYEIEYWRETRD